MHDEFVSLIKNLDKDKLIELLMTIIAVSEGDPIQLSVYLGEADRTA